MLGFYNTSESGFDNIESPEPLFLERLEPGSCRDHSDVSTPPVRVNKESFSSKRFLSSSSLVTALNNSQ